MTRCGIIENVTPGTLREARERCYEAFGSNIDGGSSVEDSVRIITEAPVKRIHRYWRDAIVRRNAEGRITAGISPCPYRVHLNGKELTMMGIGDVFSVERGTGAVRDIFARLFEEHSETALSVLYPFSDRYYSRYGYAPAGCDEEKITLTRAYIARYGRKGNGTSLSPLREGDTERLRELYRNASEEINLTAVRDDGLDWNMLSYAISEKGFIGWKKAGGEIRVRETWNVSLDDIFAFFSGEDPDSISIEDPYRSGIGEDLPEHNDMRPERNLVMNSMVRIVNIDEALRALSPEGEGRLSIKVEDDMIPSNARTIGMTWHGSAAETAPAEKADLTMDIATLSGLLVNGMTKRRIQKAFPDLDEGRVDLLSSLFPVRKAACTEVF